MTLASCRNRATSSAASLTFVPALRLGGALTSTRASCGVTSTCSTSGVSTSMGFFLARIVLGSVANLRPGTGCAGKREGGGGTGIGTGRQGDEQSRTPMAVAPAAEAGGGGGVAQGRISHPALPLKGTVP